MVGFALLGASAAACAGLVGADFDDEHAVTNTTSIDAAVPQTSDDGGSDSARPPPIVASEGGACPADLTNCSNLCVSLATDPDNCGACAKACSGDAHGTSACVNDTCLLACATGYTRCAAGCCSMATADAGVDAAPPNLGIPCSNTYCPTVSGGYCCGDSQNSSGNDVCESATSNDNCRYLFFCGSAGDCAGQVCCYNQSSFDPRENPNGQESTCQATCPTGGSYVQLCNPAASGECKGDAACTGVLDPSDLQTTYHYCQ